MGESLYTGISEIREEMRRLRVREGQAAVLRRDLADVHRQVSRVARNYQAVSERKDAAFARVLRAAEYLLSLQKIERALDRLGVVEALSYRSARLLIPQLASQCHQLLLKDETAKRAVGHLSSDAYGAAHVLLRMAGRLPKRSKRTSGNPTLRR